MAFFTEHFLTLLLLFQHVTVDIAVLIYATINRTYLNYFQTTKHGQQSNCIMHQTQLLSLAIAILKNSAIEGHFTRKIQ